MAYYDHSKSERQAIYNKMEQSMLHAKDDAVVLNYASDSDTYIRKNCYLILGRLGLHNQTLFVRILRLIQDHIQHPNFLVRQTMINAAGEIGKTNFESIQNILDIGLLDPHHAPRNAVIGSIKKMGQLNPVPVLNWASKYLQHPDKEIRREICHGIELRGRTHPQDILGMLKKLEWDKTARVSKTLVHVLGQIAYKKGCLETVLAHLQKWENKTLVHNAIEEILDVHIRYKNFSFYTQQKAKIIVAEFGF